MTAEWCDNDIDCPTFFRKWYLDAVAHNKWSIAHYERSEDYKCWLFYAHYTTRGLKTIHHIPLAPAVGPIFSAASDAKYTTDRKRIAELLAGVVQALPAYARLVIKLDPTIVDWRPLYWLGGMSQTTGYSQRIDGSLGMDAIRASYDGTLRNNLRKAQKYVDITYNELDVDDTYRLIEASMMRSGEPVPLSSREFHDYVAVCAEHGVLHTFSGKVGKDTAAVSICIADRDVLYYIMGGYDEKYSKYKAHALTLDAAITHAAAHAMTFDFEGSMVKGIADYFASFGGKPIPHHVITAEPHPLMKARKLIRRS